MMHDDMLRNIEYLREKADVSYEEALSLLEQFDGNVMRVLVELERQGRVYPQDHAAHEAPGQEAHYRQPHNEYQKKAESAKKQASSFISKALQHRLVIESGSGEEKKTIANLSAPYCAGAAIIAPHLAVGSVALMFVLGYKVKIKKEKTGPMPEDVESFVDKTVSNIKKTATSFTETVRGDRPAQEKPRHDGNDHDDDEGGEITVE